MTTTENPLFAPSQLVHGLPDYGNITLVDLEEAIREGMKQERSEWEAVATDPNPATIENTLVALDSSGELLSRATSVFWTLSSSLGGPELDSLQEELVPLLTEHADAFHLDERLYKRFLALGELAGLDEETSWSVSQQIKDFERGGVALPAKEKALLQELNVQISSLETAIEQRIAKQLERGGLSVASEDELAGLDEETIGSMRRSNDWFIPYRNFSTQLEQAVLKNPVTRRKLLEVSVNRGLGEDPETDTRGRIVELAHLRATRANLLGFPDHASLVMDSETVPGPREAEALLVEVGNAARTRVAQDAALLARLSEKDDGGDGFQAADWPYYENILRAQNLGFDAESLRPYLELDRVLEDGVFWAAQKLYGISLEPRPDLRGWHDDVRVWEVKEEDGRPLGLFLGDFYTRPGKAGGAWMAEIQSAGGPDKDLPIVSNDMNLTKPVEGKPTLLAWDDVETLFHEFGHALHGLFSNTKYRENSGTNVPRDFVELPSQLNEMWAFHPRVLENFAVHHVTGEVLPEELREALSASKTFGQGFATAEYVSAALIDQAWHTGDATLIPTELTEVSHFEEAALKSFDLWEPLVPPRYRSAYFAHTFAGGYDAGYYAYMWAEMLAAEVEEWFRGPASVGDDGGLNRTAGQRLRKELLSRGDSRDPLASFRSVTGKDADSQSVLRRRGLI